MPMIKILPQ